MVAAFDRANQVLFKNAGSYVFRCQDFNKSIKPPALEQALQLDRKEWGWSGEKALDQGVWNLIWHFILRTQDERFVQVLDAIH